MPARMYGYNPHNGKSRPACTSIVWTTSEGQTGVEHSRSCFRFQIIPYLQNGIRGCARRST
jgi:hypothetical protein